MQIQKEDIKQNILKVAKKSFIENGYRKTSMRDIAKEANVTLSNIYNYFKNKDEILEIILQPVFAMIDESMERHKDVDYAFNEWFEASDITQIDDFKEHIKFLVDFRQEVDLLFNKCSGSKYENIREEWIDRYTESSKDYLENIKNRYPQVNSNISEFFIHTLAAWWIQVLSEIASHQLSEEEILQFGKEFMTFGTGGWKMLLNM
ncbi:MAG: hypothetical protein CSB06_03950 [Bacteroidia bacterium]|nr:MAG: hypothetical protein CSB06_03950 [Bacteroidia bacterium]